MQCRDQGQQPKRTDGPMFTNPTQTPRDGAHGFAVKRGILQGMNNSKAQFVFYWSFVFCILSHITTIQRMETKCG